MVAERAQRAGMVAERAEHAKRAGMAAECGQVRARRDVSGLWGYNQAFSKGLSGWLGGNTERRKRNGKSREQQR